MELTKEYFEEYLGQQFDEKLKNVATKKDLKNFATKDDLGGFATKKDLENFATKDDLKAALSDQTAELKRYSDEQTESLARIIATSIAEPMETRFNRLDSLMDVRDRVRKIERHLNIG